MIIKKAATSTFEIVVLLFIGLVTINFFTHSILGARKSKADMIYVKAEIVSIKENQDKENKRLERFKHRYYAKITEPKKVKKLRTI